jgi:hypothetical protein
MFFAKILCSYLNRNLCRLQFLCSQTIITFLSHKIIFSHNVIMTLCFLETLGIPRCFGNCTVYFNKLGMLNLLLLFQANFCYCPIKHEDHFINGQNLIKKYHLASLSKPGKLTACAIYPNS